MPDAVSKRMRKRDLEPGRNRLLSAGYPYRHLFKICTKRLSSGFNGPSRRESVDRNRADNGAFQNDARYQAKTSCHKEQQQSPANHIFIPFDDHCFLHFSNHRDVDMAIVDDNGSLDYEPIMPRM